MHHGTTEIDYSALLVEPVFYGVRGLHSNSSPLNFVLISIWRFSDLIEEHWVIQDGGSKINYMAFL